MKKDFLVNQKYLNIPICAQKDERLLQLYLLDRVTGNEEKLTEVMVPVDMEQSGQYDCNFYAQIPVDQYRGQEIRVAMEDAPEIFAEGIHISDKQEDAADTHPVIHFAARSGWTNDPNGMIYDNGVYHLYFQYNPFGI